MNWAVAIVDEVVAVRLATGPTTLEAAGCSMGTEERAILCGCGATTAVGGWLLVAEEEDEEEAPAPTQRLTPVLAALALRFWRLLRNALSALRYSVKMPRRAVLLVVCLHDWSMPSTSCVNSFESCTALFSTVSTFCSVTFGCLRGTDGGAAGGAPMRLSGGGPEMSMSTKLKIRNHSLTKKENKRPLTRKRRRQL